VCQSTFAFLFAATLAPLLRNCFPNVGSLLAFVKGGAERDGNTDARWSGEGNLGFFERCQSTVDERGAFARFRMYLRVCVCLHEGCVRGVLVITRIFRFSCHLCVKICNQILCLHSTPLRLVCRRESSARRLLRVRPPRQKQATITPCAHR
jgi:hypothetical protein